MPRSLNTVGQAHLRRVLKTHAAYYDQIRTHLSMDKDRPDSAAAQPVGDVMAVSLLGGLHHHYVWV
jgi:hypothetical protein